MMWSSSRLRSRETPCPAHPAPRARRRVVPDFASTQGRLRGALSMTRAATRHVSGVVNPILFFQIEAESEPGLVSIAGGRPVHIGDLVLRAKIQFRLTVTLEAPPHAERLGLANHI